MKMTRALFVLLFFCASFTVKATPTSEGQFKALAAKIYTGAGLQSAKINYPDFEAGYREYLYLASKGQVKKPYIVFVNFNLPSSKKRMVVVNVSPTNPSIWAKTYVAHGANSGTYRNSTKFSNEYKSWKSSLGAYTIGPKKSSSKFKHPLRIYGKTSGHNTNAKGREIIFHDGWYVSGWIAKLFGRIGKSKGCFTVPKGQAKTFIEKLQNGGGMIYAYHQGTKLSSAPRLIQETHLLAANKSFPPGAKPFFPKEPPQVSASPYFSDSGETVVSKTGIFKNADSLKKIGTLFGISLLGASVIPKIVKPKKSRPAHFSQDNVKVVHQRQAKYSGSKDVEECQLLANKDWRQVVERTANGEDPHKFFKASWVDLSKALQSPLAVDDGDIPVVAKNHLEKVRECAALATIYDRKNFSLKEPNRKRVTRSKDRQISCRYEGGESSDYNSCMDLLKEHEQLIQEERKLFGDQQKEIVARGENLKGSVASSSSIQTESHQAQELMRKNVTGMTVERRNFQTARFNRLLKKLSAMPNHRSLLQKCQSNYSRFSGGGVEDYMAFNKIMSDGFDFGLSSLGGKNDPCQGALNRMDIKYVQNNHVKKQTEAVLAKVGIERKKMIQALKTLEGQNGIDLNGKSDTYSEVAKNDSGAKLKKYNSEGDENNNLLSNSTANQNSKKLNLNTSSSSGSKRLQGDNIDRGFGLNGGDTGLHSSAVKPKTSQIKDHDQLDEAIEKMNAGRSEELIALIKAGNIPWRDVLYMYKNGHISKKQITMLSQKTGHKIRKIADINSSNSANKEFDINKNKKDSIWRIISRRYSTKDLQ